MSENDTSTFYDRSEFLAATQAPEYATSARYRDDVAARLARSIEVGTISRMGERVAAGDVMTPHRVASHTGEQAIYGNGVGRPLGADPNWAEATKVSVGYFDGPDAVARAMAAPQYQIDPSYQQAVQKKIDRSVRQGFLTADLQAADPSRRFAR